MILLDLFWNFLLIGCFSFGGGYAMLPLIDQQVTNQGWMTTEQFTEVIAISGMLPGSIGTNAAAFVGFQTAGLAGAFVATIGMLLPSLLFILLIGKFFKKFIDNKIVKYGFYGLRPVIVGLILYAAFKFAFSMEVMTTLSWQSLSFVLMFLISLYFLVFKQTHPLLIILLSGLCGIIIYY